MAQKPSKPRTNQSKRKGRSPTTKIIKSELEKNAKSRAKAKEAKPKPSAGKTGHKPQAVVVTMLVDESGSMFPIAEATRAGFNEYVRKLKAEMPDQRVYFSALKFEGCHVNRLQVGERLDQAIVLDELNYMPKGGTPLLDACGETILATDEVVTREQADRVVVVIQTDGEENQSSKFSLAKIKGMIEERTGRGWEFVFLGAGLNAFEVGRSLGVGAMNTMSYGANVHDTMQMFNATAANTVAYGNAMASTMSYSVDQSQAVGESADIWKAKVRSAAAAKGNENKKESV